MFKPIYVLSGLNGAICLCDGQIQLFRKDVGVAGAGRIFFRWFLSLRSLSRWIPFRKVFHPAPTRSHCGGGPVSTSFVLAEVRFWYR